MQRPTMNITTDQIQKYLEENEQLIWAIMDCRSQGKLSESAQYEDQLQKNLMFLVKIADAQSQTPSVTTPQMMPHGVMPQVRHYMQQAPIFPPVDPFQFNLRQIQEQQQWLQQQRLQQQLLLQQQQQHYQQPVLALNLAIRPITLSAMPTMHADPTNYQETDGPPSEASAVSHSSSGEAGWGSGLNLPE